MISAFIGAYIEAAERLYAGLSAARNVHALKAISRGLRQRKAGTGSRSTRERKRGE